MLMRFLRNLWPRRGAAGATPPPKPVRTYSPGVFHVDDLEAAKAIILNPLPGMSTDERWEVETQNIVEELGSAMPLDKHACILDYGCGIGRLAKAVIDRYGCSVIGVDISPKMLALAGEYVNSDRFVACGPDDLARKVAEGFRATGAYACWVLQHCKSPGDDTALIESALAPDAAFYVLNSRHRWVPTDRGWAADAISIEALLANRFEVVWKRDVDRLVRSEVLARESYAMLVRRK